MTETSSAERLILVIQENPEQVRLLQEIFVDHPCPHRLVVLTAKDKVLDFLYRRQEYMTVPRPDLILLDLNLSELQGWSILTELKGNTQLRRIPIVILASSQREEDIFRAYSLQGNCYVIKADTEVQFVHAIQRIKDFWLDIVTLPLE